MLSKLASAVKRGDDVVTIDRAMVYEIVDRLQATERMELALYELAGDYCTWTGRDRSKMCDRSECRTCVARRALAPRGT